MFKEEIIAKLTELEIEFDPQAKKSELLALLPKEEQEDEEEEEDEEVIRAFKPNGFFQVLDLPSGGKILMSNTGVRVSPIVSDEEGIKTIIRQCQSFNLISPEVREHRRKLEIAERQRGEALLRSRGA